METTRLAYQYRLYPDAAAQQFLNTCFAASRKSWNAIHEAYSQSVEENWNKPPDQRAYMPSRELGRILTKVRRENPWMEETVKNAAENMKLDYEMAWKHYWRKFKNGEIYESQQQYRARCERLGRTPNPQHLKQIGRPRFKRFDEAAGFHVGREHGEEGIGPYVKLRGGSIDLDQKVVRLKKTYIPFRYHVPLPDGMRVKRITIKRMPSGRYYVSISFEAPADNWRLPVPDNGPEGVLGIDAGTTCFYLSTGEAVEMPRILARFEDKLARLQRKFSRQETIRRKEQRRKGKNQQKTSIKIARLHEKIANIRKDWLHNFTRFLVNNPLYHTYNLEKLDLKSLMQKPLPEPNADATAFVENGRSERKRYTKRLVDVSLYSFSQMLEYKAALAGKTVIKVPARKATNKTCSACGAVNDQVNFKMREWTCSACGMKHKKFSNSVSVIKQKALDLSA